MAVQVDQITAEPGGHRELLESIRFIYGYDFTNYSEMSLLRRITDFISSRQIANIAELGKQLLRDESLFEEFVQHLSVTVTSMFRDPWFYQKLRHIAKKHLATYPVIKVWLAGCATGQEVYSIAILLKEEGLLDRSILYATDINQRSLQIAREGIYPLSEMVTYTQNYLKAGGHAEFSSYYVAQHNLAMFDRSLSRNMVFSPHNLVTDNSFNEFQLIICRNVLIYFNPKLQARVFQLFHDSLCPFGFLGLGDKESLLFSDIRHNFEEVDGTGKIYQRIL